MRMPLFCTVIITNKGPGNKTKVNRKSNLTYLRFLTEPFHSKVVRHSIVVFEEKHNKSCCVRDCMLNISHVCTCLQCNDGCDLFN